MYYTDAQITHFLATRITSLKPGEEYTVRQIFSKFIAHFDAAECQQFGTRISKMVDLGKLPLQKQKKRSPHKALKYVIIVQ